jgi:hypothetical protein
VTELDEVRKCIDDELTLRGCTVTTHAPAFSEYYDEATSNMEEEFTFDSTKEAEEFHFCFTEICSMLRLINDIQSAACRQIKPYRRSSVYNAAYSRAYSDIFNNCRVGLWQ